MIAIIARNERPSSLYDLSRFRQSARDCAESADRAGSDDDAMYYEAMARNARWLATDVEVDIINASDCGRVKI